MTAQEARLIVSSNLGPIMKRIRKAVEKNETEIGDVHTYDVQPPVYVTKKQKEALEVMGYEISLYYHEEFEDEFDTAQVYVKWGRFYDDETS